MFVEDENIVSAASFWQLKKECFKAIKLGALSGFVFPNIKILHDEYSKEIDKMELSEAAELYKDSPISFIKLVRERTNLSLMDAKIFQEGMWIRKGWTIRRGE